MSETKKTILLADDDPDQIFLVKHHLEKWGYEVVAVESREEAEDTWRVPVPIWPYWT